MAKATTTTYLEIESIGADKLMTTMDSLRKSLNFVAGMLKDLNKGLGISSSKAKEGAKAIDDQAKAAAAATVSATQLRVAMAQQAATTSELAGAVDKLTKAHAEQQKKANSLDWTALKSKIDLAKQAYSAVKSTLQSLGQEALRLSQAWDVQEQAELRLQAALNAPGGIKGSIEDFKAWAGEVQNATTAGDEYVLTLAAQAARFAGSEGATKRATKAALDWAAATGGDARQAIKALGGAVNGQADSLKELGVYLSENEKEWLKSAKTADKMNFILEKLEGSYQGFSEAIAATPTGILTQCQNILGDIDEQVGRLVSPALYAGLSVVKDYLIGQLDAVNAITGGAKDLAREQDIIISGLETALEAMVDLKTAVIVLKNGVEVLAEALQAAFSAPLKPIGLVVDALSRIPFFGADVKAALADVSAVISAPFDAAVDGIKSDVKDIKAALAEAEELKKSIRQSIRRGAATYYEGAEKRGQQGALGAGEDSYSGVVAAAAAIKAREEAEKARQKAERQAEAAARKAAREAPGPSLEEQQIEAYLAHEQKLLEIQADFAEKRKVLESSTLIDYESKLSYKEDLDKQEQEALRQTKLEYARATGDDLAILEDQYRQERMAKEKAAAEELAAQQKETMQKLSDNLKQVTGLGVDMLTSWIEGTGDWRAQLYDAMKSFSVNLMKTSIASILDQALVNQAKAQGSQAAIPFVGPALALVAGAAMFATTMALKSKLKPADVQYAQGGYISAGMVRGGAWGRDSVSALLEPGERVLSKKEAAAYDNEQPRGQNVTITLNVSGNLSTPEQVRDTVRRVLLPELNSALKGGYRLAV